MLLHSELTWHDLLKIVKDTKPNNHIEEHSSPSQTSAVRVWMVKHIVLVVGDFDKEHACGNDRNPIEPV